ncbi:MAG TPA: hypothetical protein VIU15_07595 [Streptomyces sp.]
MLLAVTAMIGQIAVILVYRRRADGRARQASPWPYMTACLIASTASWFAIGRPDVTWGGASLVLLCGTVVAAEAAMAATALRGRAWAGWAVAAVGGAASATWLLDGPLPFI